MAATNEFTGRRLRTGSNSQEFRDNYDAIFGPKDKETDNVRVSDWPEDLMVLTTHT